MSNSLAIAAVTATLRSLLDTRINVDVPGTLVSTLPPDRARENIARNQINLFLYHTLPNAAWRNQHIPGSVHPGESGQTPLALTLYYMLTAYGQNDDEAATHRLLGRAMSVLHDYPVLGENQILAATEVELPVSDLHNQYERVRITLQPVSLEDLSKLWTGFQAQYRLSTCYEVSVVLIESTLPTRTPLPVLRRGGEDRGVITQPDTLPPIPPFPVLLGIDLPSDQPSAELDGVLTLHGHHLSGDAVRLRFSHPVLSVPLDVGERITSGKSPDTRFDLVHFQFPPAPSDPPDPAAPVWEGPPGTYQVAVMISSGDIELITNQVPFSLAPSIQALDVTRSGDDATIAISFNPAAHQGQNVSLLIDNRHVPAQAPPDDTPREKIEFFVQDIHAGEYLVRLRVDGIDSLFVDRTVQPPVFRNEHKVTLL
jgi:hypothetical protein